MVTIQIIALSICALSFLDILHLDYVSNQKKGTNKDIKTILKYYDKLKIKDKPRIDITFNVVVGAFCKVFHTQITDENKEEIRQCLINNDWVKFTTTGDIKKCPIHGNDGKIDYSYKDYKYMFSENSLSIDYV